MNDDACVQTQKPTVHGSAVLHYSTTLLVFFLFFAPQKIKPEYLKKCYFVTLMIKSHVFLREKAPQFADNHHNTAH